MWPTVVFVNAKTNESTLKTSIYLKYKLLLPIENMLLLLLMNLIQYGPT